MAIVKMKKFTLLTFEKYKSDLLKELQKFEDVHFKNLQQDESEEMDFLQKDISPETIMKSETELQKVGFALKKLEPFAERPTGLKALTTPLPTMDFQAFDNFTQQFDYESVCKKILSEDEKVNQIKAEINKNKLEIDNLKNWASLDVSTKQLQQLKTVTAIVGSINKLAYDSFKENIETSFTEVYMEPISAVKDEQTVLLIIPNETFEDVFGELKLQGFSRLTLHLDDIPSNMISKLQEEIHTLEDESARALENIKAQAPEYSQLCIAYDYLSTVLEREKACENFLKTKETVIMEGWVPAEDVVEFHSLIQKICINDYYLEEQDVEKESTEVPIKLSNNKLVSAFEDITAMYSYPQYSEIDPTAVLTPFYLFFFGLMVGDIGYGLILLIGTAVALKMFALKKGTRRFVQFFFYLSFTVILAGILYGGMFGITVFAPIAVYENGALVGHKAILDSQADIVTMIVLSIVIGVVQIFFGLLVKGYILIRDGKILDAVFDVGLWILTICACIALLLGFAGVVGDAGKQFGAIGGIIGGVGLALTQGRESPTLGGKIGGGLYGLYGITGYVGDFVSYTRIVALALSGAYIAFSFNTMIGLIPSGILKIVFGGLIFIFGQALNLGLALLSAYVHTCRLQYVEYFGKFYEGGGKPFKPLELKNTFVNIKK